MLLVTGGAGFIGANFVLDVLANTQEALVNVDKLTYAGNLDNLQSVAGDARHTFVQADINDTATISALLNQHQPHAIVHFAAESHVDRSINAPEDFVQTNVLGTFRLLEAARQYWLGLDEVRRAQFRFLHVSTDEVYGSLLPEAQAFTEDSAYEPNSPYAASKASSDHFVRAYYHTYGLPVITTNCSNNYGPFQFPEKLIPLMIFKALSGEHLPIYGDGAQIRDWLYVRDHTAAIRKVLAQGKLGETYNIGGNAERKNIDVVKTICTYLDQVCARTDGKSYAEQIRFVTDRPGHDRRYAINAQKIKQNLGWEPSVSFEAGLQMTIQWYLDHSDWVERVRAGTYRAQSL